ncbi:MAG TPA: hypothetical protein VNX01_01130, partial [Bacteroidia bacterium]|nr:hypothetical protein [Bacteroidia bacterium]
TSTILNDEEKKLLPDITQQKIDKAFHFNNEEKYEESIKLLNTIDKKTNKVALVLGLTYSKIGKIKDVYESIKGIKPADDSERYMLGLLHYIAQHYNESINLLKEYKGEHERMAIFFIGEMYYHLENYKEAITYCMQSIKLKDYEAYGSLIKSLQLVNDFEGAEKYCLEAISNGVKEMKIELVEIYMRSSSNEKLKKATQFIKQGLTENPEDPDFNYLNGIYFGLKGNSKMAEKFQLKAHTIYLKKNIISEPYYTNLYMLLGLLIELKQDKVMAKKILNSIKHQDEDLDLSLYSSYILIWENKYKEGFEKLMKYLESVYLTETKYEFDLLNNIILLLLAKKQYHSALKLFEMDNLNLKDRFKPVYYALMHYLKDEFPNEYLKMGEELKQPVDDIMSRIKTMAVEYT